MRLRRIPVWGRVLAGILLLDLVFLLTGLGWGIQPGSLYGWAADEILPLHVLTAVRGSSPGWPVRYPPFHMYVLEALFVPVWLLHKIVGFDLTFYPAYGWLFHLSRLLSVGMATAVVLLTYLCGRELSLSRRASLFASLLVVLNPEFVYYGKIANLDVPYTFWFAVSLLFIVRILKHHRPRDYFALTLAAVLAICTKDQAYGLYVLLVPVLAAEYHRHRSRQAPDASPFLPQTWRMLAAALFMGTALFVLIHQIPWNPGLFQRHVEAMLGPASEPYQIYPKTASGNLHMLLHSVPTLGFVFGWPVLIVCVLGVVQAFRQTPHSAPSMILVGTLVSYYLSFVVVVRYDYDRFFLPFVPVLALFGGAWLDRFLGRYPPRWRIAAVTGVCLYAAAYAGSVDSLMVMDSRHGAQRWMRVHVAADSEILGIGVRKYLPVLATWSDVSYLMTPSGARIRELAPDYLITTSAYSRARFAPDSEGYVFFSRLRDGSLGYRLVFSAPSRPGFNILDLDGSIQTNLDKISPRIEIFRRTPHAIDVNR